MNTRPSWPSRIAWMLRPDKMLFGPIFVKEMLVSGRRASTYWTRGLFALFIAGIVSLFLLEFWDDLSGQGVAERLQGMQAVGPMVAWAIVWTQFVIVALIAPTLTAACISEETSNRTLSALMTTPMTSAQIVLGKLSSRMAQLIILGLLTLPALLLLRLLGGLDTQAVLAGATITLSAAFFSASVGLLLSIFNKRPWSVMVLAEVITLLAFFGPVAFVTLYMVLTSGNGPWPNFERTIYILAHASPPIALFLVTVQSQGAPIPMNGVWLWIASSGVSILLGCIVCLLAVTLTRRTMRAHMRGSVRADRGRGKNKRGGKQLGHDRRRASRTVSDDPVFWLEMHAKWIGNKWTAGIVALIVLAFIGWIFYAAIIHQEWEALHYSVALLVGLTQVFMAMVTTTSRISVERQKRTWDVLLTTPLPAWRIVMGKLIAGIVRLAPLPLLLAAYFITFSCLDMIRWYTTIEVIWLVATWSIFLAALGLFWSSIFRRPIAASVVNMICTGAVWLGVPLFTGVLFGGLLSQNVEEAWYFKAELVINPWYLIAESLGGGILESIEWSGEFPDEYEFLNDYLTPIAFAMITLASGLIALAASTLLVALTSARVRAIPRSR